MMPLSFQLATPPTTTYCLNLSLLFSELTASSRQREH